MKTRAAIYTEASQPMVVDEIELPAPGPTQVLIRQFASGICHSQLHVLNNPNPLLPVVLGHESTGEVLDVGRDVTHVRQGDHVMVTWVRRAAADGHRTRRPAELNWRGRAVQYAAPGRHGRLHLVVARSPDAPLSSSSASTRDSWGSASAPEFP